MNPYNSKTKSFSEFEQIPKKYESDLESYPSLLVLSLFAVLALLGLLFWIYLLGRLLAWIF